MSASKTRSNSSGLSDLKKWWLTSVWSYVDIESILFAIVVWLFIEIYFCFVHRDIQDYVRQFVDTSLLIAQTVAVAAVFVLGVLLDRRERNLAAASSASALAAGAAPTPAGYVAPASSSQQAPSGAAVIVPNACAPAATAQSMSDRLLSMFVDEIPKVPIFFGGAALISAASGAVHIAIAGSATGGWQNVFRPSLVSFLGAMFLFAGATWLRRFSKTWFFISACLVAGFVAALVI